VESLGEILKTAREGKDIGFDQAGKDTKISIRYLEALEKEDFSVFPGEAYITGFIRNYGAYLDLDINELLSLYHALRIQEKPIPEQLLKRPPSPLPKILIVSLLGIVLLGGIGRGIYLLLNRPEGPRASISGPRIPVEHIMDSGSFERRFFRGDSILIPSGPDQYKLELLSLGEVVVIQTPSGPVTLNLNQGAIVSLDVNVPNLYINAMDFARNNADMGVLLRFELGDENYTAGLDGVSEIAGITSQTTSTVIFSSPSPYPFTLQSHFQANCMFRWEILMERDRRERNEHYFQRSDELNIQAQNGIRLWASNAQAARFQIIGGGRTVPVEIGSPGEVVVADIRWVRDDANLFRLVVLRLES
jgi:cytoskeletal protein RodZ